MINKLVSSPKLLSTGIAALALGFGLAASTQAAVILPEKGGFSGHVNIGAGGIAVKSNMMASIMSGKVDTSDKRVDNLTKSPNNSEGGAIPALNFELSYTFEGSGTQLHIGNLLEDFLRFDSSTVAGIRQDIGSAGLVGASYRTTTIDTQVWSDPYLTGSNRNDTDRTIKGFRVFWQQIMSSGLEIRYTGTEFDIDKERSGESLALSPSQRKLLDRNGDVDNFGLLYEFSSDDRTHIVTPAVNYIDRDLDGDAMANDGGRASVNYIYQHSKRWRWIFNATYHDMDMQKANPIYDKKDSYNVYGGTATVFYTEPFGLKDWAFNATAGYFDEDHDLDFYDNSAGIFTLGMFRKF